MNATTWDRTTNLTAMLALLRQRKFERPLRLFACACCRLVWNLLPEGAYRRAVEVAEAHAEGRATRPALKRAHKLARELDERLAALDDDETLAGEIDAAAATLNASDPDQIGKRALTAANNCAYVLGEEAHSILFADLLREIIGKPFRRVVIAPTWLTWNEGLVRHLATTIHAEQAFDRLPILGDALEDAGCADPDLLSHLRLAEPHARGCWALTALRTASQSRRGIKQ